MRGRETVKMNKNPKTQSKNTPRSKQIKRLWGRLILLTVAITVFAIIFAVTAKIIVKTVMATVNAISRPHNRFICFERGDFFTFESVGLFFI